MEKKLRVRGGRQGTEESVGLGQWEGTNARRLLLLTLNGEGTNAF